ncbi:MAG: hypothetical protein NTW86_21695, partial [Candidatus Sumerlaeota bacterium]|nr:hypothetical protein [Candidatus Sumerlaeota bacterium]
MARRVWQFKRKQGETAPDSVPPGLSSPPPAPAQAPVPTPPSAQAPVPTPPSAQAPASTPLHTPTPPSAAPPPPARRPRRIRRRLAWALGVIVALILAAGAYLTSPAFVNGILAPWAERKIGRPVRIGRVEPHWLRGFRLDDVQVLSLTPGAPPLLAMESADVRLNLTALLFGRLNLSSVKFQAPRISAYRDSDGKLSFGDLLHPDDKHKAKEGKPKKESASRERKPPDAGGSTPLAAGNASEEKEPAEWKPPLLSITDFSVRDGQIVFQDAALSPSFPIVFSIEAFDFHMRGFGQPGPAPVDAAWRARYQGVGLGAGERAVPFDLVWEVRQKGALVLYGQEYRVSALTMRLTQRGRPVGVGSLDQPFRFTWDRQAPSVQFIPAEFSLKLRDLDLAQFNPQLYPNLLDRISTGTLSGDLSWSVGGGGRLLDLAGSVQVDELGMTKFRAIDLWGAFSVSLDPRTGELRRYSGDMRLLKDERGQGKIRVRGGTEGHEGALEGSVSVTDLDLTVLGSNLAGLSDDVVVANGSVDLEQSWTRSADRKSLATRGALTCRDVVFQGKTPDQRTDPLTVHVETDVQWDGEHLQGAGPLKRAARVETLHGQTPLDEATVSLDLGPPDSQKPGFVEVRGRNLSLDDYVQARETARDGQRVARQQRKAQRDELENLLERLRSVMVTSSTLDQSVLIAPPPVVPEKPKASQPAQSQPAKASPSAPPQPAKVKRLGWPSFDFRMGFDTVKLAGDAWKDFSVQGRFRDPRIDLTSATLRLGEGTAFVQASCDLEPKPRAFHWFVQTRNLEVGPALAGLLARWKERVSGRIDLRCEGRGLGAGEEDLRRNLTATLQCRVVDGEARGLAPFRELGRALGVPEFESPRFDELTAEAALRDGRIELTRVDA